MGRAGKQQQKCSGWVAGWRPRPACSLGAQGRPFSPVTTPSSIVAALVRAAAPPRMALVAAAASSAVAAVRKARLTPAGTRGPRLALLVATRAAASPVPWGPTPVWRFRARIMQRRVLMDAPLTPPEPQVYSKV
jgi:hypothetical protein